MLCSYLIIIYEPLLLITFCFEVGYHCKQSFAYKQSAIAEVSWRVSWLVGWQLDYLYH